MNNQEVKKGSNCITNNNHLPPASLCAELRGAKKKHINDGLNVSGLSILISFELKFNI